MSVYLQHFVQLSRKIDSVTNIKEICNLASESVTKGLSLLDNVVYLKTEDNCYQQIAASGGKYCPHSGIQSPISLKSGEGVVGTVARQGVSLRISDTRQANNYIVDDEHRLSELAVPIKYQGEVLGIIDTEHPKLDFFNDHHQLYLESVSALLAPRIANIKAQQKLQAGIQFFQQQINDSFVVSNEKPGNTTHVEIQSTTKVIKEVPQLLTEELFKKELFKLIKQFHLSEYWENSPLIHLAVLSKNDEHSFYNDRRSKLKQIIIEKISEMACYQPTQRWSKILKCRFIEQQRPQQCLADEMSMGFSTFRRHQNLALKHLASELWLLEMSCRSAL